MASRPVSLQAHKNTVENRRKRSLAKKATSAVEAIIRERDIRAYAFIGIGSDGQAYASWTPVQSCQWWHSLRRSRLYSAWTSTHAISKRTGDQA